MGAAQRRNRTKALVETSLWGSEDYAECLLRYVSSCWAAGRPLRDFLFMMAWCTKTTNKIPTRVLLPRHTFWQHKDYSKKREQQFNAPVTEAHDSTGSGALAGCTVKCTGSNMPECSRSNTPSSSSQNTCQGHVSRINWLYNNKSAKIYLTVLSDTFRGVHCCVKIIL